MRFELEVALGDLTYEYSVAFESTSKTKEVVVLEETLSAAGVPAYSRKASEVRLAGAKESFSIDRNLVALPVIYDPLLDDSDFKGWLSRGDFPRRTLSSCSEEITSSRRLSGL